MSSIASRFYTVNQAAEILKCTPGRVRQLIVQGRLKGERAGDAQTAAWLLYRKDVEAFAKQDRTAGRPRKKS